MRQISFLPFKRLDTKLVGMQRKILMTHYAKIENGNAFQFLGRKKRLF